MNHGHYSTLLACGHYDPQNPPPNRHLLGYPVQYQYLYSNFSPSYELRHRHTVKTVSGFVCQSRMALQGFHRDNIYRGDEKGHYKGKTLELFFVSFSFSQKF